MLSGKFPQINKPLLRVPLPGASIPNETLSMDFVHDSCVNGARIKVLTIVDDFTRFCPGLLTQSSIPGRRVTSFLEQRAVIHGYPQSIRVDNGPEFTGKHFQCCGLSDEEFISTIPNRESQRIMLLSRASTANSGMNASMNIGL